MKKVCILILIHLSILNIYGQDPGDALKKYWRYREHLKNFIYPGLCTGCSNVPSSRDGKDNHPNRDDELDYSDALQLLGHYLIMLSSEYKLLTDNGLTVQAEQTKRELYFALEKINHLDFFAEYWWRYSYLELGTSAFSLPCAGPWEVCDINGFLMRGDTPTDFLNQIENNDYIENHLNKCKFPVLEGKRVKQISSGFSEGLSEIGAGFDFTQSLRKSR